MFAIPAIPINGASAVSADYLKGFIESAVKAGDVPADALIVGAAGLVLGAVNGGVYNPFPV